MNKTHHTNAVNPTEVIEVRSAINDNVVVRFEQTIDESTNVITAGMNKICDLLKINRVQADARYYVTKA